jgi:hypothetical protein
MSDKDKLLKLLDKAKEQLTTQAVIAPSESETPEKATSKQTEKPNQK